MRLNPYFMESIYAYANANTLVIFFITDPAQCPHARHWGCRVSGLNPLKGYAAYPYAYELSPVIILPTRTT